MNQPAQDAAQSPDGTTSRGADGDSVDTALQLAIDLHGPSLLSRPDKLRRHLEAQCPNAAFDIESLLAALEERVPQALLATNSAMQMQTLVPQLQQALAERRGLNPFAATWAVATWAAALRMDLFETDRPRSGRRPEAAKSAPVTGSPTVDASSSVMSATAGAVSEAASLVGAKTTASPTTFTVPFGLQSVPKPVPVAAPPVVTAAPVVIPFVPRPVEPAVVVARTPEPVVQSVAVIVPTIAEAVAPVDVDFPEEPVATPPVPGLEAIAPMAPAVIADPLAPAVPPWVNAPTTTGRRFNPWLGLLGVVTAIAIAIAAMRFVMPTDTPPALSTAPSTIPQPAAKPASTPVAIPPSPPTIIDVTADGPLVGDGKSHEVFVAIDPARNDIRSIEATFMSGDGRWDTGTRVIAVNADTLRDGRIAVGPIALRTSTSAVATFQYVLTTAEGLRSTPFVKQFAFAPGAPRPPAIVSVVAPNAIAANTPFMLTIEFTPGASPVTSVERRIIAADGSVEATARTTSVSALASPRDGTLRYPVEGLAAAARSTLEFTLVDGDGTRSEPTRVVVEAAAPTRTVAETPTPITPPAKSGPIACTRATCGSVVSVRTIDRTKNSEVIVRMDDRSIQALVSTTPWKVGARVRRAGDRIVAVDAVPAPARARAPAPAPNAPPRLLPESPPIFDR